MADRRTGTDDAFGCIPATAPTTSTSPEHRRAATAAVEDGESHSLTATLDGDLLTVTLDGLRTDYLVAARPTGRSGCRGAGHTAVVDEVREAPVRPDDEHSGDAELVSPMPGSVVAVGVSTDSTSMPEPSS